MGAAAGNTIPDGGPLNHHIAVTAEHIQDYTSPYVLRWHLIRTLIGIASNIGGGGNGVLTFRTVRALAKLLNGF